MKSNLLMDFVVDKANARLHITREFAATRSRVWAAWTRSELLDQWWGPNPWQARTKSQNFEPGGYWLYAMLGPEGEEHWGRMNYIAISPESEFEAQDVFCDENGTINEDLPTSTMYYQFEDQGTVTRVTIKVAYDSTAQLEQVLAIGMKEGFTMALEGLDRLLENNL
ncbi:MAG: SRPBCC domain-containing protein [Phaeodactylibacter sp.]|nr:SRPBCC domain-containing protein [Phaeodactylibacter sp.]